MSESEDPRELARRLAEEAKARALAKKLAEDAKARVARQAPAEPEAPKRSIADRAPKPMSAKDALKQALEAEARAEAERAAQEAEMEAQRAEARRLAKEAKQAAAAAPVAKAAPANTPAAAVAPAPANTHDPAAVIAERVPGAEVVSVHPVSNPELFELLWKTHQTRARIEEDLHLIVTADVLVGAARRAPPGAVHGARIKRGGSELAVFVDTSTGLLLALTPTPELYLSGL